MIGTGHRQTIGALLAGCALGLGACGGTSGPAKSDYIASADRICATARTTAAPLVQRLAMAAGSLTTARARKLAPAVQRLHRIGTQYVGQLRSLEQPSGDRDAIERFLNPTTSVVDAIGAAGDALAHSDSVSALGLLQQIQSTAEQANDAARTYGFHECGSVLTTG